MNIMKKTLIGLCAAFTCASVANADGNSWHIVGNVNPFAENVGTLSAGDVKAAQEAFDAASIIVAAGTGSAISQDQYDTALSTINDAIKFKHTAFEIINATVAVNDAFSRTDLSATDWTAVEAAAEVENVTGIIEADVSAVSVEKFRFAEINEAAEAVSGDGKFLFNYFTDAEDDDGQLASMSIGEKTAWLKAYYAKQAIENQSILDSGLQDNVVMVDFIHAKMVVDKGVIEIVTTADIAIALETVTDGVDYSLSTTTTFEISDMASLIVARDVVKNGLTGKYTFDELDNAQEAIDAQISKLPADQDQDVINLNRVIIYDGLTEDGAGIGDIRTAQGEIDKVVKTGYTVDQLIEASMITEEVNTAVTLEEVAAAQAVIDSTLTPLLTLQEALVVGALADIELQDGVTQADIQAAVTIVVDGVKEGGVTATEVAAAQAIIDANEEAVQKGLDAAQAYINTYGENTVASVAQIYNVADNDVNAVQAIMESYNTYINGVVDNEKVKKFVAGGGVDGVKALANTGHVETALKHAKILLEPSLNYTTTFDDFLAKSKPDVSSSAAGSTAGVNVVGGAIGGHQQSVVASSGKYGLKQHSLSVSKQLGMSSGDGSKNIGAWLKVFGSDSEMDIRDSVPGYDADASGVVVGIDRTFGDLTLGAAISVANIDVEGKSIANSKTDSDQHQGTLYGTMMMESFYINGSLAYGHASSDTSRNGLDGVVTGSYDTDIFAASLGIGVPVDMGSMAIIPQATMFYASISPDDYTESGIGALRVNTENMNSFGIKAGVAVIGTFDFGGGVIAPQVRLMADWDISQEKSVVNSSWVGDVDNTVYSTSGAEPASLGAIIGTGFDYASDDGTYVLSMGYDLSTRSDFLSHAGSAKFRVNF